MKHTPGPWKIVGTNNDPWQIAPANDPGNILLELTYTGGNAEANAKLVASAPDLLAERDRLREENAKLAGMLKLAVQYLEHPDVKAIPFARASESVGSQIRILLAKMGGEIMEKMKHAELMPHLRLLVEHVPHSCSDPTCPGDINRRKLEAAEEMAKALNTAKTILRDIHRREPITSFHGQRVKSDAEEALLSVEAALTAWEKAGKGNHAN